MFEWVLEHPVELAVGAILLNLLLSFAWYFRPRAITSFREDDSALPPRFDRGPRGAVRDRDSDRPRGAVHDRDSALPGTDPTINDPDD